MSQSVIYKSSLASRNGGVVVAFENSSLSFINATFTSNKAAANGHCIYVHTSRVFTKQSLVANNTGLRDGAFLYAQNGSSVEVMNTTFLQNSARAGGVARLDMSSLRVNESLFLGNSAALAGGSFYIDNESNLHIHLCRFDNGTASENGGFILSLKSEVRVSRSDFTNGFSAVGGCFFLFTETNMTLENSTIAYCRAQNGGAVHASNSTLVARNISVANSTSDRGTGGVACSQMCRITAVESSFEANLGAFGGAISVMEESVATVTRCRFSGN